ncbi:hypothetical protein FHW69_003510 [Luteibacter sp. Sphag1AF]|uniref:hypothetical protein n=1 Tax=Luteibacter sp. Sphag1AF TaxID=2587031 RepID=UPI0016110667|nr:hypothetical protein [Luteibacter sp. Sphag1AF]MBB3228865.1 hypothetical protein [Luteibacter sp. Sphag1AF]
MKIGATIQGGLLAMSLCAALAGCASSSRAVRPADARPVPASGILGHDLLQADAQRTLPVTIVRDKGTVGSMTHTVLLIDRQPVAMLDRRQKVDVFLTPGVHIFTVSYMKHLTGRPLGEYNIDIQPDTDNQLRLRLVTKDAPRVERMSAPDVPGGQGKPLWHDREDLEQYANPADVASIVDDAIAHASTGDWWKTLAGRGMNEQTRYVYTTKAGWVDLKHVISTASNPGCYVPGASIFGAWTMEVMQVFYAPFSAFEAEDFLSNRIGGNAAVIYAATLGTKGTRGQIVQRMIDKLGPLSAEEAAAHFGVHGPLQKWPFNPDEVGPMDRRTAGR